MTTVTKTETPDYAKRINGYGERHNLMDEDIAFFQSLVDEVLRNEREACARVAESFRVGTPGHRRPTLEAQDNTAIGIAKAIRERTLTK